MPDEQPPVEALAEAARPCRLVRRPRVEDQMVHHLLVQPDRKKIALEIGRALEPGDVVRVSTPGGGGYGDPAEREPRLVERAEEPVDIEESLHDLRGRHARTRLAREAPPGPEPEEGDEHERGRAMTTDPGGDAHRPAGAGDEADRRLGHAHAVTQVGPTCIRVEEEEEAVRGLVMLFSGGSEAARGFTPPSANVISSRYSNVAIVGYTPRPRPAHVPMSNASGPRRGSVVMCGRSCQDSVTDR